MLAMAGKEVGRTILQDKTEGWCVKDVDGSQRNLHRVINCKNIEQRIIPLARTGEERTN